MTSTTPGAAAGDADGLAPPNTLTLGEREVTIERPSSLKASRALAMLRGLSASSDVLQRELAAFRVRYEAEHFVELDRVQARVRYPARPVTIDGELVLDDNGQPRLLPSPVDRISEADWQAAGGKLREPESPAGWEIGVALLDSGVEAVEVVALRFLALFTIPNEELIAARKAGTLDDLVAQAADELLDHSFADELLELVVVVNETVDHHFRRKAKVLGERLGKLLAMLPEELRPGRKSPTVTPTSTSTSTASTNGTTPESPKPSSSTDTPPATDGTPTPSSELPGTSSSTSASSPRPTSSESDELEPEPNSSPTPVA